MNHIALIVTAGSGSGARIAAPFLLPAIRTAAAAVCEEIREVTEEELDEALSGRAGDFVLVLDGAMPFLTADDCRLLMECSRRTGKTAVAKDGGILPRCMAPGATQTQTVVLGKDALTSATEPVALAEALAALRGRKADALMGSGVYLLDPGHTYIEPDVCVGAGTVIHPNCTLTGGTVIGENCVLLPGCRIHGSRIGDGVTIESSILTECSVGNHTAVGPFAYLRPGAQVGSHCRVGDFVEIKNSVIGDGTKVSHLTYVGDSDLGRNINLGCGVVFVNYDGKKKHRTSVEDNAFIGCNVNLVSPVHVGQGAYVAAGSTITEDVPGGALAVARERQTVKVGWAEKRKTEGKL